MTAKPCTSEPFVAAPQESTLLATAPKTALQLGLWPAVCLGPLRRFIHLRRSARVRLLGQAP